ncbi:hypothetical protein, partial [Klebsiella pneumoniae]|uniref:hypothetical protein n=1 Tax=Klebsiella pneumoniae TaxID=573 RepID=UPI003F523E93
GGKAWSVREGGKTHDISQHNGDFSFLTFTWISEAAARQRYQTFRRQVTARSSEQPSEESAVAD